MAPALALILALTACGGGSSSGGGSGGGGGGGGGNETTSISGAQIEAESAESADSGGDANGDTDGDKDGSAGDAGNGSSEGNSNVADTAEPLEVLTITSLQARDLAWDNPVCRAITEKTGIVLDFQIIVGDADERVALMAASRQFTDIVVNPTLKSMQTMIESNSYVILDSLIEEYGPDIKALYGDYLSRMKFSLEYPNIYAFGTGVSALGETRKGRAWNGGFWVQSKALKEQGYPQIASLDEFEAVIRKDIEANPMTEDGLTRFGLSLNATEGWRYMFCLTRIPQEMNGKPLDEFILDDSTGKFIVAATQPWYKEYMRWMNHMYSDGLIDPESFTQDFDTYLAKIANGRVAGNIDDYWEWFPTNQEIINSGRDELSLIPFDLFAAPGIRESRYNYNDIAARGGYSITVGASDPAKITRFFNFITTEEGQLLMRWGIEGLNYNIDDKGMRVTVQEDIDEMRIDEIEAQKRTGVSYLPGAINEWLVWPAGAKTSNGQALISRSSDDELAMFGPNERETLAAYGFTFFSDVFYDTSKLSIHPYGAYTNMPGSDDDFVINAKTQFDQMFFPGLVKCVTASPGSFNAEWDAFMKDIEATKINLHLEHLDQQVLDRKTLWGIDD
jgi:putative aldouronate transport system substrate-binding protein